jgi:hypothetical protein
VWSNWPDHLKQRALAMQRPGGAKRKISATSTPGCATTRLERGLWFGVTGQLAGLPGKRSLRRAPSFAYGNPMVGTDSRYFVDQINLFSAAMECYDSQGDE